MVTIMPPYQSYFKPSYDVKDLIFMKVLIAGASGFIGSYIVKELLDHGHELHTISRRKNI